MSSCAIMQPTYLPWSGYFHLASKVDTFVFLDDVQFERSSWQCRNRILSNGGEHMLTVPVQQAPLKTLIRDIRISPDIQWRKKHLHSIQLAYPLLWRDARLRGLLIEEIEQPHQSLADLNITLICLLFNWLEINCRTLRASALGCKGSRSQHLAEICHKIQSDNYYSPTGSRAYLEEDKFEELSGISLHYCDFLPTSYIQGKKLQFVSHLSIIDVIGHTGLEFAKSYIRKEQNHAHEY